MNKKRPIALLLVVAMLFTFVYVIAACQPQDECEKNGHTLTAVAKKDATLQEAGYEAYWKCDVCGKMLSDKNDKTEITKPAEIPKLTPEPTPHVCGHKCPTCGKCTDNTCTDTVCKDKCQGHEPVTEDEFIPLTAPKAGTYYFAMKVDSDYWYITGQMAATYYFGTTKDKSSAVTVELVVDGEGWLIKQGERYIEIALNCTHINAVYNKFHGAAATSNGARLCIQFSIGRRVYCNKYNSQH